MGQAYVDISGELVLSALCFPRLIKENSVPRIRCFECGRYFPIDEEEYEAIKDGYSVKLYCPNKQCENYLGGLYLGDRSTDDDEEFW